MANNIRTTKAYVFWDRCYTSMLNVKSFEELMHEVYNVLDDKKAFGYAKTASFNKVALQQVLIDRLEE